MGKQPLELCLVLFASRLRCEEFQAGAIMTIADYMALKRSSVTERDTRSVCPLLLCTSTFRKQQQITQAEAYR